MQSRWILEDSHEVDAYYAFSWIGVESFFNEISAQLNTYSIPSNHWLGQATETHDGLRYPLQEARIAVLKGESEGEKITFIANFLLGQGKKFDNPNLVPWIRMSRGQSATSSSVEIPDLEFGTNALARVFRDVTLDICGYRKATNLNESASSIVNNTLFNARERSLDGLTYEDYRLAARRSFYKDRPRFLRLFNIADQ